MSHVPHQAISPPRRYSAIVDILSRIAFIFLVAGAPVASAQAASVKIAAVFSATGPGAATGASVLDAVRLAVEEANAGGETPTVALDVYDDHSNNDGARDAARKIATGDALLVVGPGTTTSALAAGPVFAELGLAAIPPYAHGAGGPDSPTTFRPVFSNAELGVALANYLGRILGGKQAVVIARDNGYGRPIAAGFEQTAGRLGIAVTRRTFATPDEAAQIAQDAVAHEPGSTLVLAMVDPDAVPVLRALARQDMKRLVLGTSAIASDAFAQAFAQEPESKRDPGYFTDGVYAISPLLLDSANADALAFAARYRARYGHDPRWEAAQGYDAARLAIAAARAVTLGVSSTDRQARRRAIIAWLAGIDSPAHAVARLTGPLWFTPDRGRQQAIRVGRFAGSLFESAPVQLVPVSTSTAHELESGTLIDLGDGRLARRQQVAYTGIFLNEIPRIDIAQFNFTADFYLWVRFARNAGVAVADLTAIDFPDLVRGSFDATHPATERELDDGTTYRLWRMRGDFKNDFDLRHYPLGRQTLSVRFFNARSASDSLVYVQDRHASPAKMTGGGHIAPEAFRNLTQWQPLGISERRDILVTQSALGDPSLVGVERVRELSGFRLDVAVARQTVSTLAKTLLPLGIMTLIMFASLHFPHALVKEKITVAITGALY